MWPIHRESQWRKDRQIWALITIPVPLISSETARSPNVVTLTHVMVATLQSPCQAEALGRVIHETKSAMQLLHHQSPCWEAGQPRWATTNKEQCNFSTCFLFFAMGGNTAREKLKACQEGCKNLCFLIGMFMQLQMLSVCYKLKMNASIWWGFWFFGFFWSVFFAIWFHKALCALGKYKLETSRDVIIGPFFCKCNNMQLIKK